MKENRKFKGVWIPREVWLDKELTIHEKIMLVEIDSLDNENGCFARNQHFCDFLGVDERRVQKIIKSLKDKGLITVELIRGNGTKEITGRVIKITQKSALFSQPYPAEEVVNESSLGGEQKFVEVVNESSPRGERKFAVSNTLPSNTDSSNTSKSAPAQKAAALPDLNLIFSSVLAEKVEDWLRYKKERREGYKETGLKSLITEIKHNAERYGEQAVADLINSCMAAGYRGIIFDKLATQTRTEAPRETGNPFLRMLREEEAKGAVGQ